MNRIIFCLIIGFGCVNLFSGHALAEGKRHVLTSANGKVQTETWDLSGKGWSVKNGHYTEESRKVLNSSPSITASCRSSSSPPAA